MGTLKLRLGFEFAFALGLREEADFFREKSPKLGEMRREKEGLREPRREKWADMTRGELRGEPQRPMPDLTEKENGLGESLGW